MARIAGVDLPRNKQVRIALTYIFGIGNPRARRILTAANVEPMKKVQDLGEDEVNRIRQVIEGEGQPSSSTRTSGLPTFTIGSMASTMPSRSLMPIPRRP